MERLGPRVMRGSQMQALTNTLIEAAAFVQVLQHRQGQLISGLPRISFFIMVGYLGGELSGPSQRTWGRHAMAGELLKRSKHSCRSAVQVVSANLQTHRNESPARRGN